MSSTCSILDLPDLVLHHICTYIDCPFDLLHFESSHSKFYKVTQCQSYWWRLAINCFSGLWHCMRNVSTRTTPREWMLDAIDHYSTKIQFHTKKECVFSCGEKWERADTEKFRFFVCLLCDLYNRTFSLHSELDYGKWLYDIALYRRSGSCLNFIQHDGKFSDADILELSDLGQASISDLTRRKFPHKSCKNYVERISLSENWIYDLFPPSVLESSCPLLMCPFNVSATKHRMRIDYLTFCTGLVLQKCLQTKHNFSTLSLLTLSDVVKQFSATFASLIGRAIRDMSDKFFPKQQQLTAVIIEILSNHSNDFQSLQFCLDFHNTDIKYEDVLSELVRLLRNFDDLRIIHEEISLSIRKNIINESEKILFTSENLKTIVRVNLTDSAFIGGNNNQQEMSAAAFISDQAVLVAWHLIRQVRY